MRIEKHPLRSPSPGTQRELQSLHYGPANSGKKAYIQASLHANELPGMLVAHHLRQGLNALEAQGLIRHEIVLVPMANPIGLSQWLQQAHLGRFEFNSGENFNRHYNDLVKTVITQVDGQLGSDAAQNVALIRQALREAVAAQPDHTELQDLRRVLLGLSIDADIVLDLHCDTEAVMHLYTGTDLWPQCEPLARYLGAHATLLAKESGGEPFDEACSKVWWQLNEHFEGRHPIPPACLSVTVELRGQGDVTHALAAQDAQNIINFLQYRGLIGGEAEAMPALLHPGTPLAGSEPIPAPVGGVITFTREPGSVLRAGDVVAEVIDPITAEVTELKTPVDGVLYAHLSDRFVTAGTKVAKVAGTKATRTGDLLGD